MPALVRDYMTPNPFTIRADAPISEAVRLMEQKQVRGSPWWMSEVNWWDWCLKLT